MFYYPQLTSGSVSQYPVSRRNQRRTVVNVLADGSDLRTEDEGAAQVAWDLSYTDLTTEELTRIKQLFESVEGRLQLFTFLDPTDNLLSWSEDLSKSTWTADPLMQIAGGVQDVLGHTGATQLTNTAQTSQRVGQTIAAASWFQYCFSVYLRANAPCSVEAIAASQPTSSALNEFRRTYNVGTAWTRAIVPVMLSSQDDAIHIGLELPAGCSVTVFGPQLEAQIGAGAYKKTTDRAGVYVNSRFDTDNFTFTSTGVDQHSCSVRIKSCVAG